MTFHYGDGHAAAIRFTDVDGDELHIEPSRRHGGPAVSLRTVRADGEAGAAVHVLADETDELLAAIRQAAHDSAPDGTPDSLAGIRFARRFVIQRPGQPDVHGVQFPSGMVLADNPNTGLIAFSGMEHIVSDHPDTTVCWADEIAGGTP